MALTNETTKLKKNSKVFIFNPKKKKERKRALFDDFSHSIVVTLPTERVSDRAKLRNSKMETG